MGRNVFSISVLILGQVGFTVIFCIASHLSNFQLAALPALINDSAKVIFFLSLSYLSSFISRKSSISTSQSLVLLLFPSKLEGTLILTSWVEVVGFTGVDIFWEKEKGWICRGAGDRVLVLGFGDGDLDLVNLGV